MSDGRSPEWVPIDIVGTNGANKQLEPTDPYVATAVGIATPDYDGLEAMAKTFIQEFALLGWSRQRLERMFRMPRYVAAHTVYLKYGPEAVAGLIDEVLGPEAEPADGKGC